MSGLPSGWAACALSDIGHIVTGKTPSTKEPRFYGGDIPFIKPGDLDYSSPIFSTETYLTVEGAEEVPSLPSQSIVVTCIGNLGKVGLTTTISATNQQINAVIPHEGINPAFIFHYCKTLKPWLEAESSATTISIVNKGIFSTAPMSLPPFAEQTRIAQKLDELLAQVDTLKARIDAIPALLKRFRQSVLAAAVSGRLTDEWRMQHVGWVNEVNPTAVPNHGDDCRVSQAPPNLRAGWQITKLSELCTLVTSGSRGWADYYSDVGAIFIRSQDINTDDLNLTDTAFVTLPDSSEGKRTRVQAQDILITITGANVGKVARVKKPLPEAYVSQHVALLRLQRPELAPFIEIYLKDIGSGRGELTELAYGGGKPGLNLSNIRELVFTCPAQTEQTEIIHRVEQLFAFADQLEAKVASAKSRIDHLTQSILAKAFRGELVPQDPNDEPASVLLARIQAQRASAPKAKRGRKPSA